MRFLHNHTLSLAVILCFIELSSQFNWLLDGTPNPGTPRSRNSDPRGRNIFPGRSYPIENPSRRVRSRSPPARPSSTLRPSSSAETSLRVTTQVPLSSPRPPRLLEHALQQRRNIILIPNKNSQRLFRIRRYIFPADIPIHLRGAQSSPAPMPTGEQNVLTASNGDIMAIMEGTYHLRGMYSSTTRVYVTKRVKVNMASSVIAEMTQEEIEETPLGTRNPISKNFRITQM